jgi:membrane protein
VRGHPGRSLRVSVRAARGEQTLSWNELRFELRAAERRLQKSFPGRCLGAFVEFQGLDRAMAISAQAFTALIPLLILIGALAPADRQDLVSDAIIGKFHLGGDAAAAVRQVFTHPGGASIGVLSVLLLVFSGVSLTRRLQRMYLQVWRLPARGGVRNSVNALLGLATLLVELCLLYFAQGVVRTLPFGWALGAPLTAVAGLLLWTSVPWLLLDRRMAWWRLLPGGALAAVCVGGYGIATTVYMPRLLETYSQRYGLFGVTLALVGWLLAIAVILVSATVVAAEFDAAQERWAQTLRGRLRLASPVEGDAPPSDAVSAAPPPPTARARPQG